MLSTLHKPTPSKLILSQSFSRLWFALQLQCNFVIYVLFREIHYLSFSVFPEIEVIRVKSDNLVAECLDLTCEHIVLVHSSSKLRKVYMLVWKSGYDNYFWNYMLIMYLWLCSGKCSAVVEQFRGIITDLAKG